MLDPHRRLLAGTTVAALLAAATACDDDSGGTANPGIDRSDNASSSLGDVRFRGSDPGSWPFVEVCGSTLLMSPNPLSGQGAAAIYQLASGDSTPIEVRLPADSESEPTDDWDADLSCVQTEGGVAVLALYGAMTAEDGALAGFDVAGNQRWVREYTVPASYEVGHDVVMLTNGADDADGAQAVIADLTSGEDIRSLSGADAVEPVPINGDRYVGAGGLVALSGAVLNGDVRHDRAWAFDDGDSVLSGGPNAAAYDAKSGRRLWSSSVPAPAPATVLRSNSVAYDASTQILTWSVDGTVYGVDAKTGEELWTHPEDEDLIGGVEAGSGVVIVGSLQLAVNDYFVLDSKTGRRVDLPDGLHVVSAGSGGIVVVEDGAPRVVDRGELG